MNDFVYNLPPSAVQEVHQCVHKDLQGYLELEVSHLNFITQKSAETLHPHQTHLIQQQIGNTNILENRNIIHESSASVNEISKHKLFHIKCTTERAEENINCKKNKQKKNNNLTSDSVQVKIVWFGERKEDAANISFSYTSLTQKPLQQQSPQLSEHLKQKTKRKKYRHCQKRQNGQNIKHQQLVPTKLSTSVCLSAHNRLQYRICTSRELFLEYLRSCEPIEIFVTTNNSYASSCSSDTVSDSVSCSTTEVKSLGQAQLRLPLIFLKKFSHNIAKGHNFVYKTKVYALYEHKSTEFTVTKPLTKSGEIQLRFKMLFAPTAAAAATAVASANHTNIFLHEKRIKNATLLQLNQHKSNNNHRNHHHHLVVGGKTNILSGEDVQGGKPKRLTSQSKSEEIVEAMKKLDAKLVAYLAGETELSSKFNDCEKENVVNLNLANNNMISHNNLQDLLPATKFNVFKSITGIKLEMEALTLQPDGTKCINLFQNEIDPIFTVECQLSNELIKLIPRQDMFHIMQFESEKFQSLTQCTRFGQKAERNVKLDITTEFSDENANETEFDFGRIHFTVWWREPGTCLNEMLGMGVLELNDLYNASLLEQCKRIEIRRRGNHLAYLYFKIALQPQHMLADSDSEKSSTTSTDKNKSNIGQQQFGLQTNTATSSSSSSISGTDKASAQNNNMKIETTNFNKDTSKVRLLKGFIIVNETRFMDLSLKYEMFLICRRFWLDEPAVVEADETHKFNYQEQFSVIHDEHFLQSVDRQYLNLELWQRMSCDDGNGNTEDNMQPVGIVRIPLHQFFIAYRDAAMTNHLCKLKFPVISIDDWVPINNCQSSLQIGEIKCLLAMGSDEQIKNLKASKRFVAANTNTKDFNIKQEFLKKLQPLQTPSTSKGYSSVTVTTPSRMKKTSDLGTEQKALTTTPTSTTTDGQAAGAPPPPLEPAETKLAGESNITNLKPSDIKLFKFALEIQKAIDLPLNPTCKPKKGYSKHNASKRYPPNKAPNCYVTFQAEDEGQYPMYKSHEGMVYATNIIEKSTQPQWQQHFRLSISTDYLKTPQKLFILKVLKKSALDMAHGRQQPNPMEDAVIGLTALDLSAFVRGLHIAGTFNIVDFNGRVNGQLVLRCHPLEEIPMAISSSTIPVNINLTAPPSVTLTDVASAVESVIDELEKALVLTHLNLGQAIKRKFSELEGITERLRERLSDVTGTEVPKNLSLQALNDWHDDDNDFDELFEHDLNTTPPTNEEEQGADNEEEQGADNEEALAKEEQPVDQGKSENVKNINSE